jgi:hypothetical protein
VVLCNYFDENKDLVTSLKSGLIGTGFTKVNKSLRKLKSTRKSITNTNKVDGKDYNGRYYALVDGRVSKVRDVKVDGKFVNGVYVDGYNSKELQRSSVRSSTRKQKFKKAPISALNKYSQNKELFDAFEVDVNKCVIVDGCYSTNKQTLKKQLIPESLAGDHYHYPTIEGLKKYDDTIKSFFRKMKHIGMIETQTFSDIFNTQVSPDKKPGFRYEEELRQRTKKEAIHTAIKLCKKRWNVASNLKVSKFDRTKIYPGVYTIGARNKRDYTYTDLEPASSRVVHMPEFHC